MFEKMTRIRTLILASAAALTLGACNNSSSNSGGNGGGLPGDLPVSGTIPDNVDQSIPQSAKLTQEQKDHFVTRFKAMKGPLLASLVWADPNESYEERQRREQELAAAPLEVRAVVDEIKNNCGIQHPTTVTTQPSGEIKPGSTIHTTMSASIRQAARACAIDAAESSVADAVITQFDQNAGTLKMTLAGTVDQNQTHVAANAIAATGLRGGDMHMKLAGAMEYGQGKITTFVRFVGTMQIVPNSGEDVRMAVDGQSRVSSADSKSSSVFNVRVTLDGIDYVLSMHMSEEGGAKKENYFLNGDPIENPGVGAPGVPSSLNPAVNARSVFQSLLHPEQ